MSVDRLGVAWINFHSGELARVNTKNANCQTTNYKGTSAFTKFGMGFASASPGSKTEHLFVSSSQFARSPNGMLDRLDLTSFKISHIGPFPKATYTPELTGTGNGNLYGYFPDKTSPFIARLDQKSGKALKTWKLSPLNLVVNSWAFAHWGGRFYLFVADKNTYSKVYRFDPATGKNPLLVKNLGHRIVGAGVSAKAPGASNDLGI